MCVIELFENKICFVFNQGK